jgi:hypothetical protein
MFDLTMIGIFLGLFLSGLTTGLAIAFPLGERHILNQLQNRSEEERATIRERAKRNTSARMNLCGIRRKESVLDAEVIE